MSRPPARFRIADAIDAEIEEPSDVVALPGGRFLVVGDLDRTATVIARGTRATRVSLGSDPGESCFEAVAFDPAGRIFVVSEERRELEIFDFDPGSAVARRVASRTLAIGEGEKRKKEKKKGRNKGVEGMAWLPAALSPTGSAHLVLAKEARPSMLVLLDTEGAGSPREISLDPQIEDACDDFSGLAVDPTTGHLFLCSDESATVAELELLSRGDEIHAQFIGATELRDPRGRSMERVEGVAIDEAGDLHVLLENDRELWRFART